jgi:hypothetical protein
MKDAMERVRMGLPELFDRVAGPLGLNDINKLRRWLNNTSTVDAHAIEVLARAVGAHPMEMLAAYGLVGDSVRKLARRAADAERRWRRAREQLARAHRETGGALFAAAALADGRWCAKVVPHFRGRRCRYRYSDYVLLGRLDGIPTRELAQEVFADAFERTGASWDDLPFAAVDAPDWPQGRVYVPRFSAPHPAQPYAANVTPTGTRLDGIIVTGLQWCGSYTVAPLLAAAIGWGLDSFAVQARGLHGGGRLDEPLADEFLRDWLDDPASHRNQVWEHVLTEPPDQVTAAARLLGKVPPNVAVVLLRPDEATAALLAAISGGKTTAEQVLARSAGWAELLPPRPGSIMHVPIYAPCDGDGVPLPYTTPGFLDDYFERSVDSALAALELLASPGKAADLIPAQAAASDPFAALAAGGAAGITTSSATGP